MADSQTKRTLIFTYGTLKQNFPNYSLIQDLILQNDAAYLGTYITHRPYPLVIGPHGIPYLINLPSSDGSYRVKGELYSVSIKGLALLDELEGTRTGHYERLPIQVTKAEREGEGNAVVLVEAEAYYAHKKFGERLWVRKGKVGLNEYTDANSKEYVRKENRPDGVSFLDAIELFLSNS